MFHGPWHFLFVAQGSTGDILPPLAVACELNERGHEVSFLTHTHFGELIHKRGLEFIDLQDEEHYRMIFDPDYWDPRKSLKRNVRFLIDALRTQYELVARHAEIGRTVAVTSLNGMGVRIAHEKLGMPMISAHICPWLLRSVESPSDMPLANLPAFIRNWDPTGVGNRIYFRMADLLVYGPLFDKPINRFRAELNLPPLAQTFHRWIHSPQLIVGLFPQWFVHPYPRDWPEHTVLTNFPMDDDRDSTELPEGLREFLAGGDPPIVFSSGTGMAHVRDFFVHAVNACARLGRRGLLLTRFRELAPEPLPRFVHYEPYVPLSNILPRAAALVSHAGIGGASQALAAGIPQLLAPMNFDQPDNARRLNEFGVARTVNWKTTNGKEMADHLAYLLQSEQVAENCRRLRIRFSKGSPVARSCDLMEEFADRMLQMPNLRKMSSRTVFNPAYQPGR